MSLSARWKLRASVTYSESDVKNVAETLNTLAQASALAGTTAANALNPYNISATNAEVLASIGNYEEYSRGRQNVLAGRAVRDSTLFRFGGNDVRVAIGGEYLREEINSILGLAVPASDRKAIIELVETRAYFGAGDLIWRSKTVK